jgi:hypothetical protein
MNELLHLWSENPPSYPSTALLDIDMDEPDELTTNTPSFMSSSSSDILLRYSAATPPYVLKFGGRASEPVMGGHAKSANDAYHDSIHTSDPSNTPQLINVYAPFKSKMDWEIAQWAKL